MPHHDDTERLLSEAKTSLQSGNIPKAIELFEAVLKIDERLVEAHEGLAASLYMQKAYPEAITHFQRVSVLDPRKAAALINVGAIYNRMGEHQKAVDILRKGLSRDKKSAEGYYNLGIAHKGLRQWSLAVSAYREATKIEPNMAEAYQNLANVYVEMGNYTLAVANFEKALEIRPDFERAKRGLAKVQEVSAQAKKISNPFGRLVGDGPKVQLSAKKLEREMTNEEQFRDRMALHGIASDILIEAMQWLDLLKERLDPDLATLHRTITDDDPAPFVLNKTQVALQQSIALNLALRKNLKRKLLELRAHEELILTSTMLPPSG
ncbi:MAG: tetratricopeptide repeat protein [Planctomycetota bacterium]|nr:tetratricopeptide repeat protein [Planctomycetota bacterium]MDA1214158.1 tetratricopeptide repeat protein [Planctomycetota bacterium]